VGFQPAFFIKQDSRTISPTSHPTGSVVRIANGNAMRTIQILTAACLFSDKFFGFQLGADRKMARWDKIVDSYGVMEKQSAGRMKVINMGPTSMGNPFLMVIITAPANMAKLEQAKRI
jgi:hypothetical protein